MNIETIQRQYKIGIIVAAVLFAVMVIDHFVLDAALLIPLVILFALATLWLIALLFIRPTEDILFEEATTTTDNWDYPGDVHEVVDLEGIGPTYADRMHSAGIYHTQELLFTDDGTLAQTTKAPEKTVRNWKAMAQLVKVKGIGPQYAEALVRGGVEGIVDLAASDAGQLTRAVNAYLEGLDSSVVGQPISEKRVTRWISAAQKMKKQPIDMDAIQVRPLESKAARQGAAPD